MKIGIDARLWAQTGVGRYIRNLTANLQEIDKKNNYVLFVRPEDLPEVKNQVTGNNWKIVEVDIKWHSLREQYHFPKILNSYNLDLVHFPYFSVPIPYKKPFIVTIHDLIVNHFPTGKASTLPLPLYKLKRAGYNRVIKHAINDSRKILVPLNAVKTDVMHSFNIKEDKIVVTYEGVDKELKNKTSDLKIKYGTYFLYVGNAYPHKNLERLLNAFKAFKLNDKKGINLVLVGKEDYFYKRLELEILEKNLSSVFVVHNVTDGELSYLYSHALSLVMPSLMEGFGLPAIEAMSNNCLAVISNIPSLREVCGDSAVYFDPLDTDSIAEKLSEVGKKGKDYYKPLIVKASQRLKLFSWEKMAKQTLEAYESSLSLR